MVGSKPGCGSVDREEAVAAKAVSKGSDRTHVKVYTGLPTKGPEVGTEHVVPEASKVMGSGARHEGAKEMTCAWPNAVLQ